jgi:hypothetical protein
MLFVCEFCETINEIDDILKIKCENCGHKDPVKFTRVYSQDEYDDRVLNKEDLPKIKEKLKDIIHNMPDKNSLTDLINESESNLIDVVYMLKTYSGFEYDKEHLLNTLNSIAIEANKIIKILKDYVN